MFRVVGVFLEVITDEPGPFTLVGLDVAGGLGGGQVLLLADQRDALRQRGHDADAQGGGQGQQHGRPPADDDALAVGPQGQDRLDQVADEGAADQVEERR